MKRIIILISMQILLSGCSSYIEQNYKELEIGKSYRMDYLVNRLEDNLDLKLSTGTYNFTPVTLGNIDLKIIASKGNTQKEYTFTYLIKDTISPEITKLSNIVLDVGQNLDIQKYFQIEDNSNENLYDKVAITDFNNTEPGTYELTFSVEDSSGNQTIKYYNYSIGIPVESISINKTILNITVGNHQQLSITYLPENASIKSVVWSSTNINVAKVDSIGNVTGVLPGSAKIIATTKNGISSETNVTVSAGAGTSNNSSDSIFSSFDKYEYLEGVWNNNGTYLKITITWPLSNVEYAYSSNGAPDNSFYSLIGYMNFDETDGIYFMPFGFNTNRYYRIDVINNNNINFVQVDSPNNDYGGNYIR